MRQTTGASSRSQGGFWTWQQSDQRAVDEFKQNALRPSWMHRVDAIKSERFKAPERRQTWYRGLGVARSGDTDASTCWRLVARQQPRRTVVRDGRTGGAVPHQEQFGTTA